MFKAAGSAAVSSAATLRGKEAAKLISDAAAQWGVPERSVERLFPSKAVESGKLALGTEAWSDASDHVPVIMALDAPRGGATARLAPTVSALWRCPSLRRC